MNHISEILNAVDPTGNPGIWGGTSNPPWVTTTGNTGTTLSTAVTAMPQQWHDLYKKHWQQQQTTETTNQKPKAERKLRLMEEQVQALLDAGKALGAPVSVDNEMIAFVPEGWEPKALRELVAKMAPAPARTKARLTFATPDSFKRYVKEHATEGTRVFCDADGASYTAFIDFYKPGGTSWVEHSAWMKLRTTPEWMLWVASNARAMNPTEFAQFIEKNMATIASPTGAEMLELVQTLEAKSDARYTAATRLTNGKQKVSFEEDVSLKGNTGTQSGTVEFPAQLALGLVPYEGGTAYRVDARLRYRLNSGRITLWYELIEPHLIVKQCLKDINEGIKKDLGLDPLEGSFQNLNQ